MPAEELKKPDEAAMFRILARHPYSPEGVILRLAWQEGLSRKLLEGVGAWRVHGGGFAGCVQALMPREVFDGYKAEMEKTFGSGSCHVIHLV